MVLDRHREMVSGVEDRAPGRISKSLRQGPETVGEGGSGRSKTSSLSRGTTIGPHIVTEKTQGNWDGVDREIICQKSIVYPYMAEKRRP